jgi:type II secretory pathway pseudopilin PulG
MKSVPRCAGGFTVTELMVVTFVIGLLGGLLLVALGGARDRGYAVQCAANLKGVGQGTLVYSEEWRRMPPNPVSSTTDDTGQKCTIRAPQAAIALADGYALQEGGGGQQVTFNWADDGRVGAGHMVRGPARAPIQGYIELELMFCPAGSRREGYGADSAQHGKQNFPDYIPGDSPSKPETGKTCTSSYIKGTIRPSWDDENDFGLPDPRKSENGGDDAGLTFGVAGANDAELEPRFDASENVRAPVFIEYPQHHGDGVNVLRGSGSVDYHALPPDEWEGPIDELSLFLTVRQGP